MTAIQSKLPVFSALLENTDIHPTRKDFNIISAIIRKILDIPELTPELLTTPLLNETLEEYRKVTEHGRKRDEIKAEIENGFTKEVLKINAGPMLAEWSIRPMVSPTIFRTKKNKKGDSSLRSATGKARDSPAFAPSGHPVSGRA